MTSLDASAVSQTLDVENVRPSSSRKLTGLQLLFRNKGATIAALILVGFVLTALFAPFLAPHDPLKQNLRAILTPPSTTATIDSKGNTQPPHYFGTDKIGRDLLSRIIYGARVSLLVAVISVTFSAILGTYWAYLPAFIWGKTNSVIIMLTDIQLAVPAILLAIVIIAGLGPGLRNTIVVIVITSWVGYTRIIRAETLSLREREFVLSARTTGCSNNRIVHRHIVPQIIPPLLVLSTLQIGTVIILEAALSFLGLGVQPPSPSWGNLLADGRDLIWVAWWMALFPGLALSLVIWASNIFGDWLRDILDPRLRK